MSDSLRLDQYLAKEYPEYSRSTWQKYIDGQYVTVNGVIENSNKYVVSEDDDVKFSLPEKQDFSERTLPIIYEDDNVIVIDKPAGVLTHAKGALNDELTVAEFIRPKTSYKSDTNRPGIIHRLDRDTSGVIICVKNDETAHLLNKQFQDRRAKKTYYAVVKGEPAHQRADIDLPIARNPKKPSTFRVDSSGKSAFTSYEVIQTKKNLSLLKLQPVTGRTHQLRVHMAYVNTPIYGDRVYGKEADRLYLHAASLEITIPEGDRRTFESKLPSSFLELTS
jgi:23S rRNA pseudouridine1911/1915/1917 synthase